MRTLICLFSAFILILGVSGCGGAGSSGSGGNGGGGGSSSDAPTLAAIAPSSATVGAPALTLLAYGSKFDNSTQIHWNGTVLNTTCVDIDLIPTSCIAASALMTTVPASNLAAAGTAKITLSSQTGSLGSSAGISNPLTFTINPAETGNTLVRVVSGVSVPNDIVWDPASERLYASVSSTNPTNPNTIAVIDPVAGNVTSFVPVGNNPNLLSISSDGSYLWAGLDGSNSVQRFLLPGLAPDISFPVAKDNAGRAQEAVALQAAPVNPRTVALVAGAWGSSPTGNGVYIYDDATARPNFIPGWGAGGGPMLDWIQWGSDDSTIYANQYTTIDAGGIDTLQVNSSGVTLQSAGNSLAIQPIMPQYDRNNGLLYSYGRAYNPIGPTLMGSFNMPSAGAEACTADTKLGRYYCLDPYNLGSSDVMLFELWVFDLNSYALLNRVYFGASAGSSPTSITGRPLRLVRWGNAGLALLTYAGPYYGNGGVFLIDGPAVNPNAPPDTTSGTSAGSYAWLGSISPDSATTASGAVEVTIKGTGFSPDSTACWNCSFLQFRFLPTTYVSSTQLNVTIPIASVSATQPLEISVFDPGSNLFSTNALTFTVLPASTTTQVMPLNLCGLSMAWDSNAQLLYVATADYDGSYPNSVVAVDPTSGAVVKSATVESDPIFLAESAQGKYLYAAYATATNLTQLGLPDLSTTVTAPLRTAQGSTWYPGDLKAAPQDPDTVAATLIVPGFRPEASGGITIYDNGTPRPESAPGWTGGQTVPALYDTLAWSGSDQLLTSAPSEWDDGMTGPLYELPVSSSGVSYLGQGTATFETEGGYIQSDFGTGLIYSDSGQVADPSNGNIVGNYAASGLVAPDSSLNRVFFLGQTASQAYTFNYTIESFDQKAFTPVSSITLNNLSGTPIAMIRWGNSGLAVLTTGGMPNVYANGLGMLYIVQDAAFVSSAPANPSVRPAAVERVKQRWKAMTQREWLTQVHRSMTSNGVAATQH